MDRRFMNKKKKIFGLLIIGFLFLLVGCINQINNEEANKSPIANNDFITISKNTSVIINVCANDSDPDDDFLTIISFTHGSYGNVTHEDDYLIYTPDITFNGLDNFSYTISDGNGRNDSATVFITFTNKYDPLDNETNTFQ